MWAHVFWTVMLLTGLTFEGYAVVNKTDGDTLSECTRALFRTHTRAGAAVFTMLALAFTSWFVPHILFGGWLPGFGRKRASKSAPTT